MLSLVNSHTNATSKRWHLWEIDLRFALNSTPGRFLPLYARWRPRAPLRVVRLGRSTYQSGQLRMVHPREWSTLGRPRMGEVHSGWSTYERGPLRAVRHASSGRFSFPSIPDTLGVFAYSFYIVYRQSPQGPVDPSLRALSGRLKVTVRRHKLNKYSLL